MKKMMNKALLALMLVLAMASKRITTFMIAARMRM